MGVIRSSIVKEKGLLLQEYSGDLSKSDMGAYFTSLYDNPDYLSVKSIFSDFTRANAALSTSDITEIAHFILTHAPRVQHVDNAILVNEPLVTAYSMLYEQIMKKMPMYNCKIFSTYKEAACYLGFEENTLIKIVASSLKDN